MSMPQTPPPDPWPFLSRLFSIVVLAFPLAACGPSLLERPAQPTTHSYLLEWQAGEPEPHCKLCSRQPQQMVVSRTALRT